MKGMEWEDFGYNLLKQPGGTGGSAKSAYLEA
jgi:hypothetical protein